MFPLLFKDYESIAHEPEPVPAVVLKVEVLSSEALQNFLVVNNAPCIHGGYLAVHLVVLVPGSTTTCPDRSLQELGGVSVLISRCISITVIDLFEIQYEHHHMIRGNSEGTYAYLMSPVEIFLIHLTM